MRLRDALSRTSQTSALLCLGVSLVAGRAEAYCRTTTCEQTTRPDGCGKRPTSSCEVEGIPLAIESACISFSVDQAGSIEEGISADQLETLVQEIFDVWQSADCGASSKPSLRVDKYPRVACNEVGFTLHGPNQNVWTFVDAGWLERLGNHTASALALTTVQFTTSDGHIHGADVEINSELFDFTLEALDTSRHDLRGILQHESGHYFGLSHSFVAGATMETYAARSDELTIRTLSPDDNAGICAIYPPGTDLSARSSEPGGGFSTACAIDAEADGCCAIVRGRHASRQSGSWLMLLASLCCLLRRSQLVQPIVCVRSRPRE